MRCGDSRLSLPLHELEHSYNSAHQGEGGRYHPGGTARPSLLASHPRGPSPQISPLPEPGLKQKDHTFSAQSSSAQQRAGTGPGSPASPPAAAARVPLPSSPSWAGKQSTPESPRPRAVRRLAQGAGFLEEISRKSAGPLASGSPPNPAGALSSTAPFHRPWGELGRGHRTLSLPPFLLQGRQWGWLRVQHGRPTRERKP